MGQELGPDNLKLRAKTGEKLMKAKSLPLSPVTIAACARTTSTELRTQGVEAVPHCGHLTMELLHSRVVLPK